MAARKYISVSKDEPQPPGAFPENSRSEICCSETRANSCYGECEPRLPRAYPKHSFVLRDKAFSSETRINSSHSGLEPPPPGAYPDRYSTTSKTFASETHANQQEAISDAIRIAVMGVTGAGKSTFIQTITGDKRITIGHNLESCTQDIQSWPWKYKGMNITFIDTPGFNDTNKSEGEILRELSDWLMNTYQQDAKLSGILYLHRISDIRMEGSALRNLRVFKKLCGEDSLQHVILVTTHWGSVSEATGKAREKELLNSYWRGMREKGSKVRQFKGTKSSAIELISELLNSKLGETTLQIQREMVDQKKDLADSSAGKVMNEEIVKLKAQYEKDMEELRKSLELALEEKDEILFVALEQEKERVTQEIKRIRKGEEAMMLKLREQQFQLEQQRWKQQKAFEEQQQRLEQQRLEQEKAFKQQQQRLEQQRRQLEQQRQQLGQQPLEYQWLEHQWLDHQWPEHQWLEPQWLEHQPQWRNISGRSTRYFLNH